jgi:hypothetical protein
MSARTLGAPSRTACTSGCNRGACAAQDQSMCRSHFVRDRHAFAKAVVEPLDFVGARTYIPSVGDK